MPKAFSHRGRPAITILVALASMALAPFPDARAVPFGEFQSAHAAHSEHDVFVFERGSGHHYRIKLGTKFVVTHAELVFNLPTSIVVYTLSNGKIGMLTEKDFGADTDVVSIAPKAGPVEIPVSNDADVFAVACDGRTTVVVGANSATPVSLVDLSAAREVATAAYPNRLARAAAVDDAGRVAVVVLDDPAANTSNEIRRLTIGAGTLVDSGEQLAFGTDFVSKVRIVPGARFGIALVGVGASRLVSFTLPGLAIRSSVTLAGGTGNALAVGDRADRVYARSGRRAIVPDVIEGFTFDPATGAIGQAPVLRIDNVAGFTGTPFLDPMAVSPDGTALLVAEDTPAPRLARYSTANGAIIDFAPQTEPLRGLSVPRACASTQTAVEFHHAAFDHYFVTSSGSEIAMLDAGTFAGWARTGDSFAVYGLGTVGTAATCRFFSTAFGSRSSHFYTPVASECATVRGNPDWQFEGEVFGMTLPAGDGSCAAPEVPLYRLYNAGQGESPNHRYTTRLDVRAQMTGQGWVPEGNGIGVIGCVPGPATPAAP